MKLVTNSNNINTLKLLICGNVSNSKFEMVFTAPSKDSKDTLPVLEVEGSKLFVPNAAAEFILGTKSSLEDESWLHWESSVLYPHIVTLLSKVTDQTLVQEIRTVLGKVEDLVSKQEYISGSSLGLVDILVWCDVYPVLTDNKVKKEFSSLSSTLKWFETVSKTPSVKLSLTKFGTGVDGCKNAAQTLYAISPRQGGSKPPVPKSSGTSQTSANESSKSDAAPVDVALVNAAKSKWNVIPKTLKKAAGEVLPEPGQRNIMITSALPYVNNVPHLGNIVGCVLSADVYARFARLRGYNVLYVCGTDEYGTQTETKALAEGLTPQQICDKYNALHSEIYQWFGISFDKFGRTTTEEQTKIAQDIFWSLHKTGHTTEDSVDQLYCTACEKFLADRFVEGTCPLTGCGYEDARGDQCDKCGKLINAVELIKPRCKLCPNSPEIRTSKHLFIDLPKIEDGLNSWFNKSSPQWTNNARVIAKSWLKGGLQPRCITRDLKWGTPVPLDGYQSKVFYVWFDAPIGYISITAQYTSQWERWWKNPENVEYWQFMAKDNVPFHSVVFPSTLLGTGEKWTLVNRLMSTEYLNYEDAKFSKSRGVGVFGNDAQETGIPADVWRFYLIYVRPENQDSAFQWDDLMMKNNSELLANLGNFVNRATKFTKDNFNSCVPDMNLTDEDWEMVARINQELTDYIALLEEAREREAISVVFNISRLGNQIMQHNTPWKLVKGSEEDKVRAGSVVGLCVNLSCLLSVLIQPYLPNLSKNLQTQLAAPDSVNVIPEHFYCMLPSGHKIGVPSPLVSEIKPDTIAALKVKYAGKQSERGDKAKTESSASDLNAAITAQGDVVRKLKADKAAKPAIDEAVKKLLALKTEYKTATGQDWKPGAAPVKAASPPASGIGDKELVANLEKQISEQGDKVRQLKTNKAEKADIDVEVALLLDLKKKLSLASGQPLPQSSGKKGKKK